MVNEHFGIKMMDIGLNFYPYNEAKWHLLYWLYKVCDIPATTIAERYGIRPCQINSGAKVIEKRLREDRI